MILSLQGCMAAGKTTAVRYLQEHAPDIHISYEDTSDVIAEIKQRNLDKNKYEDYLEIQRLWLRKEVQRWEKAKQYPITVMDFGAEEIEFYTLNYPKTIGMDWEVDQSLKPELDAVRACMPDRILFLNASEETLRRNKQNDSTRPRNFFDYYLQYFLPLKKAWFIGRPDVDVLDVENLSPEEVGQRVKVWVERWRSAEIWDAYYADTTLAGRDLVRGEPIPEGLHHLVSEILVRHTDGDYLLMQRDPRKPNYGGSRATPTGSLWMCTLMRASAAVGEREYQQQYAELTRQYEEQKERYEALQDRRKQMNETAIIFGGMLFELWELDEIPVTFKESLWHTLVDHATVYADERIVFRFKDGTEVTTML